MSSTFDFDPGQRVFFITDERGGDQIMRIGRIASVTISLVEGDMKTEYEIATATGVVYVQDAKNVFSDRNYSIEEMARSVRVAFDEHEEMVKKEEAPAKNDELKAQFDKVRATVAEAVVDASEVYREIDEIPHEVLNEINDEEVAEIQLNEEFSPKEIRELISGDDDPRTP